MKRSLTVLMSILIICFFLVSVSYAGPEKLKWKEVPNVLGSLAVHSYKGESEEETLIVVWTQYRFKRTGAENGYYGKGYFKLIEPNIVITGRFLSDRSRNGIVYTLYLPQGKMRVFRVRFIKGNKQVVKINGKYWVFEPGYSSNAWVFGLPDH